jgi:hypothetical protein
MASHSSTSALGGWRLGARVSSGCHLVRWCWSRSP